MITKTTATWQRRKTLERHSIRSRGQYPYTTTQDTRIATITYNGDFRVEIDIDAIAQRLIGRAGHNATGKASFLHGLCKATKLTEKEVSRMEKAYAVDTNTWDDLGVSE